MIWNLCDHCNDPDFFLSVIKKVNFQIFSMVRMTRYLCLFFVFEDFTFLDGTKICNICRNNIRFSFGPIHVKGSTKRYRNYRKECNQGSYSEDIRIQASFRVLLCNILITSPNFCAGFWVTISLHWWIRELLGLMWVIASWLLLLDH